MIRLDNVTKVYGTDSVAVRDVSFDIGKGDFVFLVGPSGSGKSTLLRLMNRQERPERGDVWIAGRNINELGDSRVPYLRRGMGNVFQDYKLVNGTSLLEGQQRGRSTGLVGRCNGKDTDEELQWFSPL